VPEKSVVSTRVETPNVLATCFRVRAPCKARRSAVDASWPRLSSVASNSLSDSSSAACSRLRLRRAWRSSSILASLFMRWSRAATMVPYVEPSSSRLSHMSALAAMPLVMDGTPIAAADSFSCEAAMSAIDRPAFAAAGGGGACAGAAGGAFLAGAAGAPAAPPVRSIRPSAVFDVVDAAAFDAFGLADAPGAGGNGGATTLMISTSLSLSASDISICCADMALVVAPTRESNLPSSFDATNLRRGCVGASKTTQD